VNAVVITYIEVILAVVLVTLLFALAVRQELAARVRETLTWLLKVSFFDFVQMVIFIKPWKKLARPIGMTIWLVLVYITGHYLIVDQPKLSEIPGPYIPMIGYIYYLTVLFIVSFVLYGVDKIARKG